MQKYSAVAIVLTLMHFSFNFSHGALKSRAEREEEKINLAYAQSRAGGIKAINKSHLELLAVARVRAFEAKSLEKVKLIDDARKKLQEEIEYIEKTEDLRNGTVPEQLIIESLNDGADELRVSKHGLYWNNLGAAKPGRHQEQDEPTFVNGDEWHPKWEERKKDRGVDDSSTHRIPMIPELIHFELLAIGTHRGAEGVEPRSPVTGHYSDEKEEFVVSITDSESSSRWYRFRLFYKDHLDYSNENRIEAFEEIGEYLKVRAGGLLKLNQKQISQLEKIKLHYMSNQQVENAERVDRNIKRLAAENSRLSESIK